MSEPHARLVTRCSNPRLTHDMLVNFLIDLFEHGRVGVPAPSEADDSVSDGVRQLLGNADQIRRQNLPPGCPELSLEAAIWGASLLYRAAQLLVYRDIGPDQIPQRLRQRERTANASSEHFSADLCLQYMHDVLRLSRATAEDDPLNQHLLSVLAEWPLSAVGIGAELPQDFVLFEDRALRLVFLERVVERNDLTALNVPSVRTALRAETGSFQACLPKSFRGVLQESADDSPIHSVR